MEIIFQGGSKVTINDWYTKDTGRIEKFIFEDKTLTDHEIISYMGTSEVDYIRGTEGQNKLEGKEGKDILEGDAGNDLYIVNNGDIIRDDKDGIGIISFNQTTLTEGIHQEGDPKNIYKGNGGEYKLEGTTLTFTKEGESITIEEFDRLKDRYLGIRLIDEETSYVSISGSGTLFTVSLDKVLNYDVEVSYSASSLSEFEDINKGKVIIKAGSTSTNISFKDKEDNVDDNCCTMDPSRQISLYNRGVVQ